MKLTTLILIPLLLVANQCLAEDAARTRSIQITSNYSVSEGVLELGNYWALIIGINKYPLLDRDSQLIAAKNDAQAVEKILKEKYGFADKRVYSLYDEQATRQGIYGALEEITSKINEKDSLLIYYAGHGILKNNIGSWVLSNSEFDSTYKNLTNGELKDFLANMPAKHILVIADSCYSGSLMQGSTRSLGGASSLNDRVIKELHEANSRWVMTSGGKYPVPDAAPNRDGHSTFAYHLLTTLEANSNQYLPVSDLFGVVRNRVSNDTDEAPKASRLKGSGDTGGEFIFANNSYTDKTQREALRKQREKELAEKYMQEQQQQLEAQRKAMEEAAQQAEEAKKQAELERQRMEKELAEKDAELKKKRASEPKQKKPAFIPPTF